MKFKIRVNTEPLEEYLTKIVEELVALRKSSIAQEILRKDIAQRAIWIEPSNNVSKLIDIDMILDYIDEGEWNIDLTLNPVNIHDKNAEIRRKFEERSHFWEERP